MVLAFALMGIILFGTQWLYKKLGYATATTPETKAQTTKSPVASSSAATKAQDSKSSVDASLAAGGPDAASQPVIASNETEFALDTSVYHIVFTNRGAAVKSWTLRQFSDSHGNALELVNSKAAAKTGLPFTLRFRQNGPTSDLNNALWVAHPSADGLGITYEFSYGQTMASKSFSFTKDGYLVQFADEVRMGGQTLPHLMQWRGGFGDMAVESPEAHQAMIHFDLSSNKLVSESAKAAKNGPLPTDGNFSFAGIEDQYFTAVFLSPLSNQLQTTMFSDAVGTYVKNEEVPFPGIAVGGEGRNQLGLFVGPKKLSELQNVNPKLANVIDWGWFGLIAKPLFLVLQVRSSLIM